MFNILLLIIIIQSDNWGFVSIP